VKFEGFVKKITTKTGAGRRGPWTAYSAKLEKADGTEFDQWVGLGFDAPPFKEGDYVQLETKEENGRQQYVKGSARVKKNAPARTTASSGSKAETSQAASVPAASGPSNAERQASITYQSSRKDALELVKLLLANEALPLAAAKGKAGDAKRQAEVEAAVEKYTVEFYHDVTTLRVLERVADAGVVKADSGANSKDALPEDAEDNPDPDPENGDDADWGDPE
jgi:hypothetical protein